MERLKGLHLGAKSWDILSIMQKHDGKNLKLPQETLVKKLLFRKSSYTSSLVCQV